MQWNQQGQQPPQQPGTGYNPNANAYVPNARAGAYYPGVPQPQQGGMYPGGNYNANNSGYNMPGGYGANAYAPQAFTPQQQQQQQQPGAYYPSYSGYGQPGAPHMMSSAAGGRYDNQNYNAATGWAGGYQGGGATAGPRPNSAAGGAYGMQGTQPQANMPTLQVNVPPTSATRVPGATATTAPVASSPPPPAPTLPKRKGGATLSLGKKKQESTGGSAGAEATGGATEAKTTDAPSPDVARPATETESSSPTTTPITATPVTTEKASARSGATNATSATATSGPGAELTREAVRKELARQREQNKKQFVRDPRPHFNVVFCGHVDAGKSTISGHLLMEKGLVDQREMDKLRREAEIHHREGWEFAYVMDVSEEERSKGITRETGAAYFETEKRRVTVLDAPGHKAFVPSMIGGATQADICVLVISSRTGEFETGFEKGGQTREHAMLVRTCGVKQMICVVNKMDEMHWSKERYDQIIAKLKPFLRQNGYDEDRAKNLVFIPVAGLTGENLIKHTTSDVCDWYTGPTLMDVIDSLVLPETRREDDVLCIPLVGSYKDDGRNYIYGKVESGSIAVGEKIQLLPTKQEGVVDGISIESTEFDKCYPGDNVHLRVRGIDESDVHAGYVATSVPTSLRAVEYFQARVVVLEVKNIISAGSRFMLHIHSAQEEASFGKLFAKLDRKTGKVDVMNPACAKAGDVIMARIDLNAPLVVEPHKDFDKMGRFMLRDEGKTIAIGLVTKLYESTHDNIIKSTKDGAK